jgi:transposase
MGCESPLVIDQGEPMPAAYSYDLRARVVHAVTEGASRRRGAVVFKVSAATVVRWTQRLAETGSRAASPTGGDHKSKAVETHKDWLLAVVAAEPDLTMAEIQTRLKDTHGLAKRTSCLWRFFARHNVTFKKTQHATEQDRPDVKAERGAWRENQPSLDPGHLVFIDETGVSTNMARLRGRALEGQRLIGEVPHGHWNITTFVAALRCDGITAPMVTDGAMNGTIFLAYIRHFLLPTLKPGDWVIMDNPVVHKVAGVRTAIESVGASA